MKSTGTLLTTSLDDAVSTGLKMAQGDGRDFMAEFPTFSAGFIIAQDLLKNSLANAAKDISSADVAMFNSAFLSCDWSLFTYEQTTRLQFLSPIRDVMFSVALFDAIVGAWKHLPIIVTNDGYIIQGDTQWLSGMLLDHNQEVQVMRTEAPFHLLFPIIKSWF
jgi:hypothetical protein